MTAVAPATAVRTVHGRAPTVWGLTPHQVHDRFWASFGVQVVRHHEKSEIVEGAELFLLCEPDTLVTFRLREVLETLTWLAPAVLFLRVRDTHAREYQEVAVFDADERFVRFDRLYAEASAGLTRVALTTDASIARRFQAAADTRSAWRDLRRSVADSERAVQRIDGHIFDGKDPEEVVRCLEQLVLRWRRPDAVIRRARRAAPDLWADEDADLPASTKVIGGAWVGCGRSVGAGDCIVGPAILWDHPDSRPEVEDVEWQEILPGRYEDVPAPCRHSGHANGIGKRAFDIAFALVAVALTLPLYPLVFLAMLLEDGRPFFFAHRRESRGGREFPCLKFRSMRKDAERIKESLRKENLSDGPQFFLKEDPRLTRVGRILRKTQIDELPQFLNVLLGHMSIVGPRPSPRAENQYCPPWREARLSVRPGITGLWQVMRTRRQGCDFQEWIRYDLQYVEEASWRMDLRILARTVLVVLRGSK